MRPIAVIALVTTAIANLAKWLKISLLETQTHINSNAIWKDLIPLHLAS